ncbi:hypothetical protein MUG78_17295 [Gordonia alkaliphila]|uniref:hypothetical protein n=1 Tax=Gordonia alkaliphila TaxID=1053547 RepID=UPI001FF6577A|nr:hypothetical protein [Gordonia alkaliphila]MCK0441157.1 hypothetical protein [Gordonia alkaliphila]
MDAQQAQDAALDIFRTSTGQPIPGTVAVTLDDAADIGAVDPATATLVLSPAHLEHHYDQYRQITGDSYDVEDILNQLPWS